MSFHYERHQNFPDEILIRNFYGNINAEEIINSWKILLESNGIDEKIIGVIHNLTFCVLQMNPAGFNQLIEFMKNHTQIKNLKQAIITIDSENKEFPLKAQTEEKELKICVFANESDAIKWILNK